MKIWTLLITHLKLSIVLSKKMPDIGKIFAEYSQKTARPGPAEIPAPPARPGPICQAWDLQPCAQLPRKADGRLRVKRFVIDVNKIL